MKYADNILITGASSGIGEALALECARRGAKRLFLCGRDAGRLEGVAVRCRAEGADVRAEVLDVADEERAHMTVDGLLQRFAENVGHALDNDRILLSAEG